MKEAILLAGGYGTRLKPLTNQVPKCLVEIAGKPLLEIWLDDLSEAGINKFYINTHYLAEQVTEFIKNSKFSSCVELFYEENLLGTGGTLKRILPHVETDDFLLLHADNYCECTWGDFFEAHNNRVEDSIMTMMLFEAEEPKSCGIVVLDEGYKVVEFHEKVEFPPSNLANSAIYIVNKEKIGQVLARVEETNPDISLHLIPLLMGRIQTWKNNGYLCDIGTIDALEKTVKRVFNK